MENNRVKKLKELLLAQPEDLFLLYALALEFMQAGQAPQALEYFKKIRNLDPSYLPLYYQMGKLLSRLQQKSEAIEILEAGLVLATEKKESRTLAEISNALSNLKMGLDFDDED